MSFEIGFKKVFMMMDSNNNGDINISEFVAGAKTLGINFDVTTLQGIFREIDTDVNKKDKKKKIKKGKEHKEFFDKFEREKKAGCKTHLGEDVDHSDLHHVEHAGRDKFGEMKRDEITGDIILRKGKKIEVKASTRSAHEKLGINPDDYAILGMPDLGGDRKGATDNLICFKEFKKAYQVALGLPVDEPEDDA